MSGTTQVLLFQVGVQVYAATVKSAARIGTVREVPADSLILDSVLGRPVTHERGIVVASKDLGEEHLLVVDKVLGFRSLKDDEVRPLPRFAEVCLGSHAVSGLVLFDRDPLPLIDLETLVHERLAPTPR